MCSPVGYSQKPSDLLLKLVQRAIVMHDMIDKTIRQRNLT